MKYLKINRTGFRQYECTNENGKIVQAGISYNVIESIKNCFDKEFHSAVKYVGNLTERKTIPFSINIENGTHYIGSRLTEWYEINIGDWIVMDISKNIYIAKVSFGIPIQHVRV